jgi:hypothetical protein
MSDLEFKLPKATGLIRWKDEKDEPGVDTKALVDHRFALVQNMIEDATKDFASALLAMRGALTPIVVRDLVASGISVAGVTTDIPEFTGSFTKTFTATLEDFDVAYAEPSGKPDASEVVWEDGTIYLQQELIDKLAVWLLDGESAIPQALFDEIYTTATTQLSEDVNARRQVLIAEAAARGWDCPEDIVDAKLLQLEREYSKGAAEVSAKIAERNMELIQTNFHKAAELAVQYIQVQFDYIIRKNLAKIDWYSKAVDAWIKQVEAEIAIIEAKVAAFAGKVEAYKAKAAVFKTEADVFESTVRAYVAIVEGLKAKIGAQVEAIKAEVMVYEADSRTAIENEKLRVEAQIANNELAQRIAEADSNFHSQLMASGMGSLHVQAGVSASHGTGEQVGFSYNYGEQYSEQQSRSETTSTSEEIV